MALSVSTSPELSTLKFSDQGTLILSSSETKKGNSAINSSDIFQIIPTYALSNIRVSVDAYGGFWSRTYINASPDWSGGTPLYVSAISGQTGDLTKWQNSAGTTLARVASNGVMKANVGLVAENSTLANYTALQVNSTITNGTGVVVQGASGQTANLQEWYAGDGTLGTRIGPYGELVGHNQLANGIGGYIGGVMWSVISGNSGYIPIVVKGAASQTANLQQWQNSAGTVLASIDSNGIISLPGGSWHNLNGLQTWYKNVVSFYQKGPSHTFRRQSDDTDLFTIGGNGNVSVLLQSASAVGLIVKAAASQTANLQEWQDSAGTVLSNITAGGSIETNNGIKFYSTSSRAGWSTLANNLGNLGFNYAFTVGNSGLGANLGTLTSYAISASTIGLVVRGAASQTANLQEWQDSTGTVIAKVTSGGSFTSYNTNFFARTFFLQDGSTNASTQISGAYFTASAANSAIYARTTSASIVPLVVQGTTSQTADLQQWQDSNGNTYAKIGPYGQLAIGDSNPPIYSNARISLNTVLASVVGQVIRGVASQSADLQQWQNSAGTVLAAISGGGSVYGTGVYASYLMQVTSGATTQVPMIVKGAASQTANLQEWQNSAGTVFGQVDSNGNLNFLSKIVYANQLYVGTGNYLSATMHNISGGAGEMRLLLRAHGSQTASIQEWQNSSGTALAKVDANGNFSAISKSFDIAHPTKENMRLRYASLEGPENGVYIRGTVESNIIELPEYWTGLVHEDSITVSLTAVGSAQNIYVEKIENNKVYIGGELTKAFFTVYGERKDIDKLTVEY